MLDALLNLIGDKTMTRIYLDPDVTVGELAACLRPGLRLIRRSDGAQEIRRVGDPLVVQIPSRERRQKLSAMGGAMPPGGDAA